MTDTEIPFDRSTLIQGADVSSYEGDVNWTELAKEKVFAFIRVSHGAQIQDATFQRNWTGAKAAGVIRGAYHYLMPNQPIQPQIDYFIKAVGALEPGDLPPTLDLEEPEIWTGIPQAERVPLVLRFLDAMEKAFGVVPMIYLSPNFVASVLGVGNVAPLLRYKLWIANYHVAQPTVPVPWQHWTFWQFAPDGRCSGVNGDCDLNVFSGTLDELRSLTMQPLTDHQVLEAASDYVQGIDVSTYQNDIDWNKVAGAKKKFVLIRASHGAETKDDKFQQNWAGAKRAGITRGAYHYFRPDQSFDEQVDYFINTIGTLEPGDLPPVLDLEEPEVWQGIPQEQRVPLAVRFLERLEQAFGVVPIVYTSYSFVVTVLGEQYIAPLKKYGLWVANYRVPNPKVPPPWSPTWSFWQYSDQGKVTGIDADVDLDAFSGTLDDLKRLTVQGVAETTSKRRACRCCCKCCSKK